MRLAASFFAATILFAVSTLTARANQFSFSFNGQDIFGSGGFQTNSSGLISNVTGTVTFPAGGGATTIIGKNNDAGADNILNYSSTSGYTFSANGLALTLRPGIVGVLLYTAVDGSAALNEFYVLPSGFTVSVPVALTSEQITNLTTSAVPEPESLVLFGTGLLGLVSVGRRKLSLGL